MLYPHPWPKAVLSLPASITPSCPFAAEGTDPSSGCSDTGKTALLFPNTDLFISERFRENILSPLLCHQRNIPVPWAVLGGRLQYLLWFFWANNPQRHSLLTVPSGLTTYIELSDRVAKRSRKSTEGKWCFISSQFPAENQIPAPIKWFFPPFSVFRFVCDPNSLETFSLHVCLSFFFHWPEMSGITHQGIKIKRHHLLMLITWKSIYFCTCGRCCGCSLSFLFLCRFWRTWKTDIASSKWLGIQTGSNYASIPVHLFQWLHWLYLTMW